MAVQDISGRVIGTIESVLPNRFRARLDAGTVALRPDCLFNVTEDSATLVCHESNVESYLAEE